MKINFIPKSSNDLRFLFISFFVHIIIISNIYSQIVIPGISQVVSGSTGNNTNPTWSPEGNKLLFQSDRNTNWDIFMYLLDKDSLVQITKGAYNETDPVWYPGRNCLVFTSDESGEDRLYIVDLSTGVKELLIKRDIQCKEASFSKYGSMITFSGYNENSKTWQVYTYDFKYDNLNQLTHLEGDCHEPALSPDGKLIAFTYKNHSSNRLSSIYVVNWYGDFAFQTTTAKLLNPSWTPDSFRIIYVNNSAEGNIISSIRNDGTSNSQISDDLVVNRFPVISPDGKLMAVSVLNNDSFELIYKFIEQ